MFKIHEGQCEEARERGKRGVSQEEGGKTAMGRTGKIAISRGGCNTWGGGRQRQGRELKTATERKREKIMVGEGRGGDSDTGGWGDSDTGGGRQ